MKSDSRIIKRKNELTRDAWAILNKIKELDRGDAFEDPLTEPAVLAEAVNIGILDAPHLCGVKAAKGTIMTMIKDGMNFTVNKDLEPVTEVERLDGLGI